MMNAIVEQLTLMAGGSRHLASLAMHEAGSMTREELVTARGRLRAVVDDLARVEESFREFDPVPFSLVESDGVPGHRSQEGRGG